MERLLLYRGAMSRFDSLVRMPEGIYNNKKIREKRDVIALLPCKGLACNIDGMPHIILELELDAQSQSRRVLENRAPSIERIRCIRHARESRRKRERVVLNDRPLRVEDVEPVSREAQLTILAELNRIVGAEVQLVGDRRATFAR